MELTFVFIILITVLLFLLLLWELPKIDRDWKKERTAFITILVMGWILAILLILHPDLPGPTEFLYNLFNPLNGFLE